ncbi:hypothetical protein, partial [Vibrio sp. 10N.261.55.A7]|uniref:hypothetical protein n=1 Tax=Vibrio sp. 10N.261.55.A7 TaxID=1880851 RepID=UPI0018E4A807
HLYPVILTSPDLDKLDQYFKTTTKFLESTHVSFISKTYVIDFENQNFKEQIEKSFAISSQGLAALNARIELSRIALSSSDNEVFGEKDAIRNVFSIHVSKAVECFVYKGQFIQAGDFLSELLDTAKSSIEKSVLVTTIVAHNSSYNLRSRTELNSFIEEHEELISDEDLDYLRSIVNSKPGGVEVHGFLFGNGTLSINSTKDKDVVTLIRFSIPSACYGVNQQVVEVDDKLEILLSPVSAFWADPMFRIMSGWNIANMGWSHFCDVEPEEGKSYTHILIAIKELYTPDVKLNENGYENIDFSEKEALIGRTYYPHKEFVVKTLLANLTALQKHIVIDKKDINVNMFSNYFVQHIDQRTKENIHHKLYAITNPNSYSKTLTRFVERLNSVNLSDAFIDIRELMLTIKIETEKSLKEFVFRCVDLFVKHNIENHGDYKYLWKNDETGKQVPCREPETQPYIFNHLRAIFDFMGIQISREVESSNGEVDFLVSFTNSQNKLLKLCVELKLAHAVNVEKGLTKQLPAYMKGERCKYGIYLVLWYRCELFGRPEKYAVLGELEAQLNKINANKNISNLIIDCTKPVSPSKLR